jgi:hypothetical protein
VFVADVLRKAGVPVGKLHNSKLWEYEPTANDWADSDFKIPGWRILGKGEEPQPGDVAALPREGESGHVGIVVRDKNGNLMTVSAGRESVNMKSWGIVEDRGDVVFRRRVGT